MKKKQVIAIIKSIIKKANLEDYECILDYTMKCGTGYCDDFFNKGKEIHIGIKELKGVFNNEVSDIILTKIIINTYHELRHSFQQRQYYSKTPILNENINNSFINYLACVGGYWGYYNNSINPRNYFTNPRELDAEYNGIKNAYDYISILFSEEKAEKMILNYLNSKIGIQYYIEIREPINNISKIEELFKKAIVKNTINKKYYNTNYIKKDNCISYCQEINDEFVFAINEENNPVMQDKIIAGAYVKYIEDKNIKEIIKKSFLYNQNKNDLLENINNILYKSIEKENDYEFNERD